jgi:TPR repeat protein
MVSRDASAERFGGGAGDGPSRIRRICALGLISAISLVLSMLPTLAQLRAETRAETRIALVIGNGSYTMGRLANPVADAELMTKALAGVGFDVIKLIDADATRMRQAFVEFGRRLSAKDAGKDTVGLFYFAGHAVQVQGQNYLIPLGADIRSEAEVPLQALNLSELLAAMKSGDKQGAASSSGRLSIAVLDACRDNPFAASGRALKGGLAAVSAPTGTLIAYATAPGQVASDGTDGHSPYAAALARTIPTPGLTLEDVFKRTREQVLKATGNAQTPWEHSSLTGAFIFKPKAAVPEPSGRMAGFASGTGGRRIKEIADWEKVKDRADVVALQQHIAAYPGGAFEELAHYKIAQLQRPPTAVAWWQTGSNDQAAANRTEADAAFERAVKLDVAGASADDLKTARDLYLAAASSGGVAAMLHLARAYDRGLGVAINVRDLAKAADWYARAAAAGHPAAQAALGTMYEFGEGVPQSLVEALRHYRLAADRGDPAGQASLGFLFAQGKGVARDAIAARKWYLAAAAQGHARAQFNLALMYIRAEGGPLSWPDAVRWLKAAAGAGHAGALRELAYLHDEGRGVARNPEQAAAYLIASYQARARSGSGSARPNAADRREAWSRATRIAVQKQLAASSRYTGKITGLLDAATRQALDGLAAAE